MQDTNTDKDSLIESIEELLEGDKPIIYTPQPLEKRKNAIKRTRQMAFLKAYAKCGSLTIACNVAGVNKHTERDWRRNDKWYLDQFKDAYAEYCDGIEENISNWALNGLEEPIIGKVQTELGPEDRIIGTKVVRNPLITMFHAKRHIREYRDRVEAAEGEGKAVETVSPFTRITITLDNMHERQTANISILPAPEQKSLPAVIDTTAEEVDGEV